MPDIARVTVHKDCPECRKFAGALAAHRYEKHQTIEERRDKRSKRGAEQKA